MSNIETDKVLDDKKLPDAKGAAEYFRARMTYTTGPVEASRMLEKGEDIVVLDVRRREDYEREHVPGAISLPPEEWASKRGLSRDKLNLLYCYSHVCHLAAKAALEFATQGYSVMEMEGGFQAWKDNHLDTESKIAFGHRTSRATDTLSTTH